MKILEKKKFNGLTFSRTLSYPLKKEAQEAANNNRKAGYLCRVTSTKLPTKGYSLYHVWVHYPLTRKKWARR